MSYSTNFYDAQSVGMIYFSILFTFETCVGCFLGLVMHSTRWPRFTSILGAVLVLGGAVTSALVDPFPITSTLLFLLIGTGIGMARVVFLYSNFSSCPKPSLMAFFFNGGIRLHFTGAEFRARIPAEFRARIPAEFRARISAEFRARISAEFRARIPAEFRARNPAILRVGFGILPQLLGLGFLVPFAFESINFEANGLPFTALVVWGALAYVITTISSLYVIPRFGRKGTIFLSLLALALFQVFQPSPDPPLTCHRLIKCKNID
nr:oocyst capsule protein, putative [Ipomoea batatas]